MTFAFALVLVMAATGLWATGADEEEAAAAADKKYVTDPSTGMVVEAPRYGGSLTFATKVADDNLLVDAWVGGGGAGWIIGIVNEKLGIIDWAIDRNKHPYFTGYGRRRSHCVERWLKAGRFPGTASPIPSTSARACAGITRHR